MNGIFLQVIQSAKRDRLFIGSLVFTLISTAFGIFMGSNATVEQDQAKIIYTAGFTRNFLAIALIMFTCLFIKKMFENKEIDVILSKPISRTRILVNMFFSFFVVLFFMCLPNFLIMAIFLKADLKSSLFWITTIYLEGIIALSFSVMYSLILRSSFIAISGALMSYFLSRAIGEFVAASFVGVSGATLLVFFNSMIESLLKVFSVVIPRLDLFGKSKWLIYQNYYLKDMVICVMQTFLFSGLMFFAALHDFKKKQF